MAEVILRIENLSKTLGGREILHNISFDTYGGEVFGFLGTVDRVDAAKSRASDLQVRETLFQMLQRNTEKFNKFF